MDWLKPLFWRHSEILEAQYLSDNEKIGYLIGAAFELTPTGLSNPEIAQKVRNYYHDHFMVEGA